MRGNLDSYALHAIGIDLAGPAALLSQRAGRAAKKGLDDNFGTRKQIVEVARR